MIVIYAEKPDIAEKLSAILGKCFIDDTELTLELILNAEFHKKLENYQREKGYQKCEFEGKEYLITWGFGHMAELKNAKDYDLKYKVWKEEYFPFIPEHFQIEIKNDAAVKKQFQVIKKLFNDPAAEAIINATDADREGQLIFDWVKSLSKTKKPCKRLWLNSYTEEEVVSAMHNLKPEEAYINLTRAARCRTLADWMVGINLTAVGTCKYGSSNNKFSIGRVQTAVLDMLVEREKAIINFESHVYYEVQALCSTDDNREFTAVWEDDDGNKIYDKKEAEKIVDETVKNSQGMILDFSADDYRKYPPLLYDLTTLQMDANVKYGLTAKETLETAQKLYQNQFITYPRTNSRFLPKSKKCEIQRIIENLPDVYGSLKEKVIKNLILENSRVFDDSKVGSHYAIIPTYKTPSEDLSEKEIMIYGLIARSVLKVFMNEEVWKRNTIVAGFGDQKFVSRNRKLVENGWKEAEKHIKDFGNEDADDSSDEPEYDSVDNQIVVDKCDRVRIKKIDILEKTTRHPARFTEKSLLQSMETCGKKVVKEELKEAMKAHGIGTPATRSEIIEKLIVNKYIVRAKRYVIPTYKAVKLIEKLPIVEIKSPELTGEWEYKLNLVEKGELSSDEFFNSIKQNTVQMTETLKTQRREYIGTSVLGKCPEENCSGQIIEGKKGYGCTNYTKGCKFVIWKSMYGVEITPALATILLASGITGRVQCKKKDGTKYTARLKLIKDKESSRQKVITVR